MINYILVRNENKNRIRTVKVTAGEEVVRKHKLLVCTIDYEMHNVKTKWRSKSKIWKLKEENKINEYKEKLKSVNLQNYETVNAKWNITMLKAADEVFGKTKGLPRHQETWW